MPSASILIKPASSNCNLDCQYCFYKVLSSNREEYSKGFMSLETLEKCIENAIIYADGSLTFAFQGGEPMLVGIDFYQEAVSLQKKYQKQYGKSHLFIENTIQTNGTLIDDTWAAFFHDNHFLVGLSLDGPKKCHDRYRVDVTHNGTFEKVMGAMNLLKTHQVDFNILTVVTEDLTSKASYLYKFYQRSGFPFVQLIPCMDEPNRPEYGLAESGLDRRDIGAAVTGVSYGRFLCEIFDLWYEDFIHGQDMEIRMFSNLAQMCAGYPPEECGMSGRCHCYFVVEGDGSVYPCDFYCLDQWKLGTLDTPFETLYHQKIVDTFVKDSEAGLSECMECAYEALCHGGCKRWREDGTGIGKNALCEGYQIFFAHTKERLKHLGELIQQSRR